jgi:hypothetical protein
VDIEVISVETHLQELDFKGSQADIKAFLEEQVSKYSVQFILALMVLQNVDSKVFLADIKTFLEQ